MKTTKKLVAFIIATIIAVNTLAVTASASEPKFASWKFKGRYYAQIVKVIKIRERADCDVVRIINANRQVYEFYTYRGDFEKGDRIAVIMDGRGTKKVFDDWVVAAKFDRPDLL